MVPQPSRRVRQPSRRAVLRTAGAGLGLAVAGCLDAAPAPGTAPTDTPGTASPGTPTDTLPASPTCEAIEIELKGVDPRPTPSGTVTFFEDYVVVEVTTRLDDPPPLRGRIENACDGERTVERELSRGTREFAFGPFGHHCVGDYRFWIAGCDTPGE